MNEFVVYVNRVHRFANIHKSGCSYIRSHGGVSQTYPPTGWYLQGFDTLRKAEYAARWSGFRVEKCGNCLPDGHVGAVNSSSK